ncbi:MAG: aminoacyl--tRNA ligase-related protein [Acidobacteriota bacterium]
MNSVQLDLPVPRKLQDDLLKNLYWVDSGLESLHFDTHDDRLLCFKYRGNTPVEDVNHRLKETADRLARSLKVLPEKVYYSTPIRSLKGCTAPYENLVRKGWVTPTSNGMHAYRGLMYDLYQALDAAFRREALALRVEECKLPALMDLATLARTGYLESFPHNANLITHLPEQAEVIDRFKQAIKQNSQGAVASDGVWLAPSHALSPTVCYHFYQVHQNQTLPANLVGATAVSPCYRFEGKAMQGLRRLREFNMREIIFLGSPDEVLVRRQALLELQKEMLQRCHLQATIQTASDPFFLDTYDKRRLFQMSFDLKYEVQAYLPEDDTWLAIGSVNYHQDHFGKAFGIRQASGETAESCCLGFGIDRWCFAIFAQHGLDPDSWPETLQHLVSSVRSQGEARS